MRNIKRASIQDMEAMPVSGHRTRAVFDRYDLIIIVDEADLASAGKRLEEYAQNRKQERATRWFRAWQTQSGRASHFTKLA